MRLGYWVSANTMWNGTALCRSHVLLIAGPRGGSSDDVDQKLTDHADQFGEIPFDDNDAEMAFKRDQVEGMLAKEEELRGV